MRRSASTCSARRRWRGGALLEFAAVAPILVLLAGLAVEFGNVLHTYNTLVKAVRSATRRLAMTDSSNAASASWLQARQEACNLAVYGVLSGGVTPLLSGLDTSMVKIDTSGRLLNAVYGNSQFGCGTNCGISTVTVTISGYGYQPLLGKVLPAKMLKNGQLPLDTIALTMRSWPFASALPNFPATSSTCAALI